MKIDLAGWCNTEPHEPEVIRVPSARTSPLDVPLPLGVCFHWTAGDYSPDRGHVDSVNLARSIVERPPPKDADASAVQAAAARGVSLAAASWHVLIDKDGVLVQSASMRMGTWHVSKEGPILGRRRWPNRCLVGVELENAGQLKALKGGVYAWPWYQNPDAAPEARIPDARYRVNAARAVPCKGGLYDAYTPQQEQSAELLLRAGIERFGWKREALGFGHSDFDAPRKQDPGPLWQEVVLPRIFARIFPPAP